jgi:hypothetical protein
LCLSQQVTKASETEQVDKQRLLLSINQQGRVLSIDSHSSESLYGFAPEDLIDRPLAAFINVFAEVSQINNCQHNSKPYNNLTASQSIVEAKRGDLASGPPLFPRIVQYYACFIWFY